MYLGRITPIMGITMICLASLVSFLAIYIGKTDALKAVKEGRFISAFTLSAISCLLPVFTFISMILIFTLRHSHPTIQLAGEQALWSTWLQLWPYFLFGLIMNFFFILSSFVIYYKPSQRILFQTYRILVIALNVTVLLGAIINFPDA